MKVEVIVEDGTTAGVPTFRVVSTAQGISLRETFREVQVGPNLVRQAYFILTFAARGKIKTGDRIRISEVQRTRAGARKVSNHYEVGPDISGISRLTRFEVNRVPIA